MGFYYCWSDPFLLTNVGITVVPACMCRPIIEFSQVVYIIDPDFHLVLVGYQPALVMSYIALIPRHSCFARIYQAKHSSLWNKYNKSHSCNNCSIGTSDLPDIYARARGPLNTSASAYISGKSRMPMYNWYISLGWHTCKPASVRKCRITSFTYIGLC